MNLLILLTTTLLPLLSLADDVTANVAALQNVSAHITTLNDTLNTFTSNNPLTTIPTLFRIQSQSNDLVSALQSATSTARASAPFNDTGSAYVGTTAFELQPRFQSLARNFVAHKPVFDTAIAGVGSVSPQIKQDLVQQRNNSRALGDAVTPLMTITFLLGVDYFFREIDKAYETAIANYSTAGGSFSLPPVSTLAGFEKAVSKAASGGKR